MPTFLVTRMLPVFVMIVTLSVNADPVRALSAANGDHRRPASARSVLLPVEAIMGGVPVAELTVIVVVNERELFREKYAIAETSKVVSLRLQGAGLAELLTTERLAAGSVRFDLVVDGARAHSLTIPQLLALSDSLPLTEEPAATAAVSVEVQVNRTNDASSSSDAEQPVVRPGPQRVTRLVTPPGGASRLVSANSTFVCPSGQNGTCNDEYWACYDQCDPADPGYYEACLARCQEDFDWCYYGQTGVDELRWFQPLFYLGLERGFYPWYAVWDLKMWERWSGDSRYQRRETYYCKWDGTFGPYVVADETTADICLHKTLQDAEGGGYRNECKF